VGVSEPDTRGAAATRLPAEPIDRILAPFREFSRSSVSGGVLLLAAAVVAILFANSPWSEEWTALWETELGISLGSVDFSQSLLHWINDGLMAVFFLVVGLEIKREVLVGELATRRRATLPIVAAVGGAVVPALIFLFVVGAGAESRGWGIPMATDIAFALGALAILGSRIPLGLRVFLTALAIADDLLAVLVIALFYTSDLSLPALAAAGLILGALVAANLLGVRHALVYGVLGVALWLAVFQSGRAVTVSASRSAAPIARCRGRTRYGRAA
jgi:NhaA family Na+:H+ antiporter